MADEENYDRRRDIFDKPLSGTSRFAEETKTATQHITRGGRIKKDGVCEG